MINTECKLRTLLHESDGIGVDNETIQEVVVPITRVEKVYASEFYRANEQGLRPVLRIVINALNYNNETELEYNGVVYTIIRIDDNIEELALVCERKLKNV